MEILPIITIIIISGLTRLITGTWLSPGSFFTLCWSFFLFVPLIFSPEYKIDHIGLWFITIFSMALSAGSIIAYAPSNNPSLNIKNNLNLNYNHKPMLQIFILLLVIAFIGIYLLINYASKIYYSNNYSNSLLAIPNLIAIDRYGEILDYPFLIKYSLYFIYPANLLGGLIIGLAGGHSSTIKFFSILPILAAIVLGMIEGARTSIILGGILFFSGWLSTLIINQKLTMKNQSYFRIIIGIGTFIIMFIIFFIFIQWLRQGMDTLIFELLINRIRAYFFGYLSAFSLWLGNIPEFNFNPELITFAGPLNLIGIMERPLGFYQSIYISNGVSTNIFTAFRGIVSDFSIPGSILIAFFLGFIYQSIFQKINQFTIMKSIPISMFYAFTLYSPLISIFHYNSMLFSWIIILIPLILSKYEFVANNR